MGTLHQPGKGPATGDPAPDFVLRHTLDREVGLRETLSRGPAVLAFYVFDFGNI